MSYNYSTIMGFISSSELNRCKKNWLFIYEANNWIEVIKYPWLTRKLRRKIGHLWTLGILAEKPRNFTIGTFNPDAYATEADYSLYKDLANMLQKQFLVSEDYYILHGELPK